MSDFEPIDFTSIDDIPGINAKALFSSELSKTEFRETGDISSIYALGSRRPASV